MSVISLPRPRLPDQLTVNFGPTEAIAESVLRTDFAVRKAGIRLCMSSDFEELEHANRSNRTDWYPLTPNFNSRQCGLHPENAFWLKGVDDSGDVVLTHCVRLYALRNTLKEEIESLRFYFDDPDAAREAGANTQVTAPMAARMNGRVTYSGALWVRSDFRGAGLARLIPPLSRALALTRWYPQHHMCILTQPTVERGMAPVYGYEDLEYTIWLRNLPGFAPELKCALCWMTNEEATAEVERIASARHREVGIGFIGQGRQDTGAGAHLPG